LQVVKVAGKGFKDKEPVQSPTELIRAIRKEAAPEFADFLRAGDVKKIMFFMNELDPALASKFNAARAEVSALAGLASDAEKKLLIAIGSSKTIPPAFMPLMATYCMMQFSDRLGKMRKGGSSSMEIELALGSAITRTVDEAVTAFKKDRFLGEALHRIYKMPLPPALGGEEKTRDELMDKIINTLKGHMSGMTKYMFEDKMVQERFRPALETLPTSVLKDLAKAGEKEDILSLASYYIDLHVAFLEGGGWGGPANVIEAVAKDERVPEGKKLLAVGVVLRRFFEFATNPDDLLGAADRANDLRMLGKMLDEFAANPGALEAERKNLEMSLKLRNDVADKISTMEMRARFLRNFSLHRFMRTLHKLDEDTMLEFLSLGPAYTNAHAAVFDKGWVGVPATIVERTSTRVSDPELCALVATRVMQQLQKEPMKKEAAAAGESAQIADRIDTAVRLIEEHAGLISQKSETKAQLQAVVLAV